jgi:hypothetical protein
MVDIPAQQLKDAADTLAGSGVVIFIGIGFILMGAIGVSYAYGTLEGRL